MKCATLSGLILLACCACALAGAPPPRDLARRAGFDQRLGMQTPMERSFREADGRAVTLDEVSRGRPLLLALGYYKCPNLCDTVLQGMAHAVQTMSLQPGRDYEVVFVSIDPHETPADAAGSVRMLSQMQPAAHIERWHLLTGEQASIEALAGAVGFRYFYDARIGQYAHAAGVVVLTAQGRVAQYLFGASYPAESTRLALIDASHGKLGNVIDRLVLLCCGYDPVTGRYSLLIGKVMRVLGIVFALLLLLGIGGLWLRGRARE
jgi:protein SCO1/2